MHTADRIKAITDFLNALYAQITGKYYTYLWLKKDDEKKTMCFEITSAEGRAQMAKIAIAKNDEGFDVYFGVNLMDKQIDEHRRAKTEDIVAQAAIIADIDCESAWHVSNEKRRYPPTVEVAQSFLPKKPSIVVESGGGIHAYNFLEQPLCYNSAYWRGLVPALCLITINYH